MPYPCRFCSVVPETIGSSIRHQRFHAKSQKTFTFFCPAPDCIFQSSSYAGIDFHISTNHRNIRHVDPEATEELFCNVDCMSCFFSSTSLVLFVRHLYTHLDAGFNVSCPIDGCSNTFQKKSAFRVHLPIYHKHWSAEGVPKQSLKTIPVHEDNDLFSMEFEEDNGIEENNTECGESDHSDDSENIELFDDELFFATIGKFYLSLYAEKLMAQTTIQYICNSITYMTEVAHARMKVTLTRALQDFEVPERKIDRICYDVLQSDLLYTSHNKNSPGPSLTTHHLRKKFFKKQFGFFEPTEINLDEDDPDTDKKLQYVPVKKSLTVLFEDPSIQKEIEASFSRPEDDGMTVSDYQDGTLFKSENHPKSEIQLLLHQDSYNPVPNVLGSAKNKYKCLVVYFTIGNLKPHLRSKIVTKHLVMMIRESIFKQVGAKKSLEELISEIKDLEDNGISFKGETVPVTVEFMLGDSLGQHLIGGFIECFSAEFMCRFCVVTRQDMKADPLITKEPRTVADFNLCALRAMLTGNHCKGIKATCELNQLKYFHASSHLVPCIAHDCYEGAFSWDMSGIIAGFVDKKWFSYKLLNKRIKKFKCVGVDSTNKPAFVPSDGEKLGGHAVQNWTMIRLFYFIIGDKIQNFEDDGWLLYLKLKELSEHFCVPSFKKSAVPYIKDVLLPSYFNLRKTVLPQVEIRPKHHYVAHYPDLMLRYGPLIYIWTLPFEQKHKFFKELMRNTKNYINPEFTCAERQQMYFCLTSLDPMFEDVFIESSPKDLSANSFSGELSVFISSLNLIGWSCSPNVVANYGINYKCKDVLILIANDEMSLSIGILKVIISKGSQLNFILEVKTATYISAIGNYEIDLDYSGNLVMVSADSLKYPVPQPVYPSGGKMLLQSEAQDCGKLMTLSERKYL